MKFKKLIPLILILVLSIQFLFSPLQRIAAWLSSGQVTEELADGLDTVKSKSLPRRTGSGLTITIFQYWWSGFIYFQT